MPSSPYSAGSVHPAVPSRAAIEQLEPRRPLSVSLNAAGYTVVVPERDDRAIYVSSSKGSDAASGLSAASPVRSLERGYSLLRDGRGDQLLLKRGDTWTGPFPGWTKGGASADRPMVLGAYDTGARPTIATSGSSGFHTAASGISHLVIQGIRITAAQRDPTSTAYDASAATRVGIGLSVVAGGADVLIEDCLISHFATNVAIQNGGASNVRLRRNVIVDAHARGSSAQGLFVDRVRGLLLEGNVFDHNGWNEAAGSRANIFSHNAYITASVSGVTIKGNIFANAASHGLQARSGGDILDNLFVANPLHLSYGLVRGDGSPAAGGVSGVVNGNVFLGTRDIDGQVRGVGIQIANTRDGGPTLVSNNIFSNVAGNGVAWQPGGFAAISLEVGSGKDDAQLAAGLNDLSIQGNIIRNWAVGMSMEQGMTGGIAGSHGYRNLAVKRNEFSGITSGPIVSHPSAFDAASERWVDNWYSGAGGVRVAGRSSAAEKWAGAHGDRAGVRNYADPGRSLQSFAAAEGFGDAGALLAQFRATDGFTAGSPTAADVIAHVRAGYEVTNAEPRNWNPPTPPTAEAVVPSSVTTDETGMNITVTYRDDDALDASTIDADDVAVWRGERRLAVTLASVTQEDARTVAAVYRVASPNAVWRSRDAGVFRITVAENQVRDTDGFAADAGVIWRGGVDVIQLPPPPVVKRLRFIAGRKDQPDRVVAKLSTDLSALPSAGDLVLTTLTDPTSADGIPATIDLSAAAVTYDAARREVTWTLPTTAPLPAGRYSAVLRAGELQSTDLKPLDGNADGVGGDDYSRPNPFRIR